MPGTDPIPSASSGVEVTDNIIHRDIVKDMLDAPHEGKFFNPIDDPTATERLKQLRELWSQQAITTVFTSGVFDVFHLNHAAFLLQVKLEAVPFHFAKYHADVLGCTWESLSEEEQREYCHRVLSRGDIKLIVSVDGDAAVSVRKKNKGGGDRPIYSWQTRATDVLNLTSQVEERVFSPVVDAVTIHDDHVPSFQDTPHEHVMPIAAYLQPDVWPVYCESEDIFDSLRTEYAGQFPSTGVVVMSPHEYYTDALLGGKFSTTKIATRLGGAALSEV